MPSQVSATLEQRSDMAASVRRTDRLLLPMLFERSQAAKALWDLGQDAGGKDVLTLALTDPWNYAADDFALEELENDSLLRRRFHDLIGDLVVPRRDREERVRIELRDGFVTTQQLEQFRQNLGSLPDIRQARVRLHNQVRFLPQRPDRYLLTDFAVEVNQPFEQIVCQAAVAAGFHLRNDPWLIKREGVREALRQLVEKHRHDGEPLPDYALCFRLRDREAIHLLEVSRQAAEVGDGALDGVGFAARGIVPHARTFLIYLAHPGDLRLSYKENSDHPFFHDLRTGDCEFLFPDDGGAAFHREFPELPGA